MQLSNEQKNELQSLLQKVKNDPATAGIIPSFSELWPFLQASEKQLTDLMCSPPVYPPITSAGDPEFGLTLYQLNNLHNSAEPWYYPQNLVYDILEILQMPTSNISATKYSGYLTTLNSGPGVVAGDGTYMSTATYGSFDTGWHLAAYNYMLLLLGEVLNNETGYLGDLISFLKKLGIIPTISPFATSKNPITPITSAEPLTISVFGDWGTGQPVAQQLLTAIQSFNPTINIHLGDVYYAGTTTEEINNLLTPLKNVKGTLFTLNSNHEMYDGATGYFGTALANSLFSSQNGASYFALEFENWVLLGLDSAYFDTQSLTNMDFYMNGALFDATETTANPQVAFVNTLDLTGKQVIVCTHHNGISFDGSTPNQPLLGQLYSVLGNRYPDFWYYGHIHDGVVYTDPPALKGLTTPSGNSPQLRCSGHAALPYGVPYWLQNPTPPGITYFAQTIANNPNTQLSKTIRNGFAILTLRQNQVIETFYEVDIKSGNPVQMWTHTTNF